MIKPDAVLDGFTGPIIQQIEEAGFRIQEQLDFIPLYAMWRVYVLRKR